jgi:hypothetical protein
MAHRFVVAFAVLTLIGAVGTAFSQTAPSPPANAPVPYVLSMGDMMNTLIQPRHIKLGIAGKAENWPLANYALAELRQVFDRIAKAQPKFRNMPVADLIDLAMTAPFKAVDVAIKDQDAKKFAAAYDQATMGCNACHMELEHPYVVIKTPEASAFPDQDFAPKR